MMEEGLRCPLPDGWVIRKLPPDEDGTACHEFVHEASGRTSNSHPMDEVFIERAKAVMRKHAAVVAERRAAAPAQAPASPSARAAGSGIPASAWADSSDDDAGTAANRRGARASAPQKRPPSLLAKQIRFVAYAIVLGGLLHFITYRMIFAALQAPATAPPAPQPPSDVVMDSAK